MRTSDAFPPEGRTCAWRKKALQLCPGCPYNEPAPSMNYVTCPSSFIRLQDSRDGIDAAAPTGSESLAVSRALYVEPVDRLDGITDGVVARHRDRYEGS